ncbi:MAG: HK97 family phage prohead protease [Pseudomonadota bacterium]
MPHPTRTETAQHPVPFYLKSINDKGLFCGYASVFNTIDAYGDCIVQGAFKESLQKWQNQNRVPKMLWQHNTQDPIGIWELIEEDKKGLYVEGQLLLDVQKAREAYSLIQHGAIDGLSIGYQVVESEQDPASRIRYISTLELFEVSVVTFAANLQARVTQVKQDPVPEKVKLQASLKQAVKVLTG